MEDQRPITIYTDGSCSPNPGPGGWAAILTGRKTIRLVSAGLSETTTNSRMELTAALEGLKVLSGPSKVTVVSDSTYLVNGATKWLDGWQARRWKNVKNVDLWQQLLEQMETHDVTWQWVRGHSGNEFNELADKLATEAAERRTRSVRDVDAQHFQRQDA